MQPLIIKVAILPINEHLTDLKIDKDGVEGGLEQLAGVVDGVTVEHHELQRLRQLEDPLDLVLDVHQVAPPGTAPLYESLLGGVVQGVLLGQRDVRRHPGDDDPALELPLEVVEQGLLHHVRHLVPLERGPDDDDGPHAGHHVVGRDRLDLAQQTLLLLLALDQGAASASCTQARVRLYEFALCCLNNLCDQPGNCTHK